MMRAVVTALLFIAVVIHPGGSVAQSTERSRTSPGTVGIVAGGVTGTAIRIASDLGAVLDREGQLRIMSMVGKGSVQNVTDLLYLRGIDLAIVPSDVLNHIQRNKIYPGIAQRIRYVTKLYNEEVHVLAGEDIGQVSDLAGRTVNVDVAGSGTALTSAILFDALRLQVETTNYDQALALEKLKAGEIAALVFVDGKPSDLFQRIPPDSKLRFLPVPLNEDTLRAYLPSSLTSADYPALIPSGQSIDTVAVGAVLAVYNWTPGGERYRQVGTFVESFFDNFEKFLEAPRHPKWREVNLAADLPGWTRFQPAQDWLDRRPTTTGVGYDIALRDSFEEFMAFMNASGGGTTQNREALFASFLAWRKQQQEQPPALGLTVLTGAPTGVYYPLGQAMAAILGRSLPGAQTSVQATQGSVQNLNLLQAGRGEIAFSLADAVGLAWAGDAEGGFATRLDKLRTLAAIYPNYVQVVAARDAGIRSLDDLAGKRVSVGAPRSGTEINARRVFAAAGLTYDRMTVEFLPFGESVELMKARELDATLQSAGLGVASIRDLAGALPVVVVPIPSAVVARIGDPAYLSRPIPAGTYRGQDAEVMTVSINNLLMTRQDVPADVVYALTRALFDNLAELTAAHPAARGISLEQASRGSPVPLHPGAERFYRERGVLR